MKPRFLDLVPIQEDFHIIEVKCTVQHCQSHAESTKGKNGFLGTHVFLFQVFPSLHIWKKTFEKGQERCTCGDLSVSGLSPFKCVFILTVTIVFSPTQAEWCTCIYTGTDDAYYTVTFISCVAFLCLFWWTWHSVYMYNIYYYYIHTQK